MSKPNFSLRECDDLIETGVSIINLLAKELKLCHKSAVGVAGVRNPDDILDMLDVLKRISASVGKTEGALTALKKDAERLSRKESD